MLIAVTMNAVVKTLLALLKGNRQLAFWLGSGFLTMLGTGALVLAALYFLPVL